MACFDPMAICKIDVLQCGKNHLMDIRYSTFYSVSFTHRCLNERKTSLGSKPPVSIHQIKTEFAGIMVRFIGDMTTNSFVYACTIHSAFSFARDRYLNEMFLIFFFKKDES